MQWAVSQAAPLRRMWIEGDLNLFAQDPDQPGPGYSSGGFMADCHVTGTIASGTQQQWFTRNTYNGNWLGGVWNLVFVGVENAPDTHCSNVNGLPITNIKNAPYISEKPFITVDSSSGSDLYKLQVPKTEIGKVGTSNFTTNDNLDEVDFSQVYVANENDTAEALQAKHDAGI